MSSKKISFVSFLDGVVVKANDVHHEEETSQRCIVIECPNEKYLDSLLSSEELKNLHTGLKTTYVFHFTPKKVMLTEKYRLWMNQYPESEHVLLNDSKSGCNFPFVFSYTKKLQTIAPKLFPSIWAKVSPVDTEVEQMFGKLKIRNSATAMKLDVRSSSDASSETMDVQNIDEKMMEEEMSSYINVSERFREVDQSKPAFPCITFLGTGSGKAGKYRSPSCILVEVEPDSFFLLDCGEGEFQCSIFT